MKTIKVILLALCAGVCFGQVLTDAEIQSAIDAGRSAKTRALWQRIEKRHSVRINRQAFVDTVGKTAIFLNDADLISLASSDAARRHQNFTVEDVKLWPNPGLTRVLLVAVAGGIYIANLPKWQAPAVHMTITADGNEIQPASESVTRSTETKVLPTEHGILTNSGGYTSYTPLYQSALYDVAKSRTWFSFALPKGAKSLRVTVISADGHEKFKDFDPAVL
jgi:hypothetical protein